jgi:hypothetical protein
MSDATLSPGAAPRLRVLPSLATMGGDALYLTLGLPAGVIAFSVLVTGLSLAAGLAITLVGLPILLLTLYLARWMGDVERARASLLLGTPVRRRGRAWTGRPWPRFVAAVSDGKAWLEVLWGVLLLPIGIAGFTLAVTAWSTALGLLTSPLWYWTLSDAPDGSIALLDSTDVGWSALRVLIGLLLVPVAAWVCRAAAEGTARTARELLG